MTGDSWKDDPLEYSQPIRGKRSFLDERSYSDPTETKIKFEIVSLMQDFSASEQLTPEAIFDSLRNRDDTLEIGTVDISRILRGNVASYSLSFLMTVLATLGARHNDYHPAGQGDRANSPQWASHSLSGPKIRLKLQDRSRSGPRTNIDRMIALSSQSHSTAVQRNVGLLPRPGHDLFRRGDRG